MALIKATAAAKRSGANDGDSSNGTGSGSYKVKGKRATAKQRRTINGVLSQAKDDKASRRVMIATVMCITQESEAGELAGTMTGDDDVGIFQQGRNWISVEGSKDPEQSTHAFLITGPTSWKTVHGGVKNAPGNLPEAIHRVQGNARASDYAPWENEATETVDEWLDSGGSEGGGTEYVKRYSFTRGEQGGSAENSWDAAARLVDEVGAYRWAAANTFYAVSGDELRSAAPVMTIRGNEGWLLQRPAWSWAANRAVSECTFMALAERWALMPGACVALDRAFGALSGKWLVWNVSGSSLDSPEVSVVLRRPTALRREPAHETASRDEGESGEGGKLKAICGRISDIRVSYVYGGGHGGKALSGLNGNDHMDCSSSVSLALYRAKMFGDRKTAITSGEFASSWGKKGKGDEFTVWANSTHVWIEGYNKAGKPVWRFDTSQHGGKSGPALLTEARTDQARFTPKHWPGH